MSKVIKYSVMIILLIVVVSGCLYFYLMKDGYQVTFNSNGGSIVAPMKTGLKKKVESPEEPVKSGFEFAGWYLNGEKFDFDSTIEENITLTAHWESLSAKTFLISFETLGGTNLESVEVEENHTLPTLPTPTKEGFEFISWYYHNKEFDTKTLIDKNMVLVAKYKKVEESSAKTTVTITFDSSGGSSVDAETIEKGKLAKMPKAPTKEGFEFIGWYLNDTEFTFLEPVNEDITLVAKWKKS